MIAQILSVGWKKAKVSCSYATELGGKSPFRLSQEETLVPPLPPSQFLKGWVLFLEEVCTTSKGSGFFVSQTEKTRLRHKGASWLAQTSPACVIL